VPIALFLGTICLRGSLTKKDMKLFSKYSKYLDKL
jgi:hypothetical protein